MAVPHPAYSLYVHDMMARLGIEPGGAAVPRMGMRYATAVRRCETCRCKNSCRDWLDCAPPLVNFAPGFCANAGPAPDAAHTTPTKAATTNRNTMLSPSPARAIMPARSRPRHRLATPMAGKLEQIEKPLR